MDELKGNILPVRREFAGWDWFAEDEGVCVVELELGGIFEVGFSGMQDHEEQVGLEELEEGVAFEDNVDGRGRVLCALAVDSSRSSDFLERGAKERHAFGEKSLLGAEPETALRASGEEARAVGASVRGTLPIDRADVLVGCAIAIVAVLRADTVPVLRDFAGDPVGFGQGRDDVADELCFANAARVAADDNDARVCGGVRDFAVPF